MKDGAVVVLYNPEKDEYKSILDYAGKVDITLILDNSPTNHLDNLMMIMNVDGENIIYQHYPDNLGLCKGMNIGISFLFQRGCEWILTMNSDSYFQTDILDVFRKYVKDNACNNVAILAPQFNFDRHPVKIYKGTSNVGWVMMSGNYVNADAFLKLDGFLEELFVDGLDIEYCLWAKQNGYQIVECGEAVLEHMPATTKEVKILGTTVFKCGVASPKRYAYQAKSLIYIIRKYHRLQEVVLYFYKIFKIIFVFDNKGEYIKEFFNGTRSGFIMKGRE